MSDSPDSPLTFPCEFPIKVVGASHAGFEETIAEVVREHDPWLGPEDVVSQPSRQGTYVSVTVTVAAQSREQLDAIYRALTAREDTLFVL